jgi:hypothetical protein
MRKPDAETPESKPDDEQTSERHGMQHQILDEKIHAVGVQT